MTRFVQAFAVTIGEPLRWVSCRVPEFWTKVLVHLHRPLIGNRWVAIQHRSFTIMVSPQDNCGGKLYYWGKYEPEQTAAFISLLQTSNIELFVDIGANIGYYTLIAAELGVPRVLSFEVSPPILEMLNASMRHNTMLQARISIVPKAVSDREGEILFWLNQEPHNYGLGSTVSIQVGSEQATVVAAVCLDTILNDIEPQSSLIKMDIEGGELLALRGMIGTVKRLRPILLIEVHPRELENCQLKADDVLTILQSWRYRTFLMEGSSYCEVTDGLELKRENFWLVGKPEESIPG